MKIKKVRKQEVVTKFSWSTKISKSYILLLFLNLVSNINALLIILQSLLAQYQLLLHKKSIFTILLWLALHFTEKLEQIRTHIPYCYFVFSVFMVQSSRAIDKEWGSKDDHLLPLTMAVTIYFKGFSGKISFSFSAKPKRIQ